MCLKHWGYRDADRFLAAAWIGYRKGLRAAVKDKYLEFLKQMWFNDVTEQEEKRLESTVNDLLLPLSVLGGVCEFADGVAVGFAPYQALIAWLGPMCGAVGQVLWGRCCGEG